ncbi:hypothetical protein [Paraburkholderia sp. BL6665CI2N2]|uniref:hypothetical protein n=1 Tax=Paraburkholderia sp. BL6665CI2N2 TaxID=1938806 RepID=UPI001065BC28|nr:hypothetical protein [Paraburkholderia sp. BL6665CI2N2]
MTRTSQITGARSKTNSLAWRLPDAPATSESRPWQMSIQGQKSHFLGDSLRPRQLVIIDDFSNGTLGTAASWATTAGFVRIQDIQIVKDLLFTADIHSKTM